MNVHFLKFYKTSFLFLFIASFFSCTEIITEQSPTQTVTQVTYCEVSFSVNGDNDSSSRAAELKNLEKEKLYYTVDVIKENGTTEKTYPESGAWTYSELYKAKLRLSSGNWKFTLNAYNNEEKSILVLTSGQTPMAIKAGTNTIKFEMKEPVDGTGDFTMKMTLGSDVNEVTATLCHLDGTDVTAEELGSETVGDIKQIWPKSKFTTSDDGKTSYVEYNIKNIKKGYYMVRWEFSKENDKPQTFNSLATVVTGCANSDSYDLSEEARKNPDVVSYYSVSYDLNVDDESLVNLPEGITLKDTKLYKEGDDVKIITFELVREGYDFVGWRPDSTHIYEVPENKDSSVTFKMQTANVKLTASWIPSNSTKYTVRHWNQKLNEAGTAAAGTDTTITEPTAPRESATCVDYELKNTTTQYGTTEKETKSEVEPNTGFTAQPVIEKTIAADGSTVVDIFYNRNLNTAYIVRHHLQDLNDAGTAAKGTTPESDYSPNSENTRTGITGAWTSASAKTYIGYTKQAFEQQAIAADGSTVIDIYYNRNNYAVEYNDGVENETITVPETKDWCYGSKVTVATDIPTRTGYTFIGWGITANATEPTYSSGATFTMETNRVTLYALWKENAVKITVSWENNIEIPPFTYKISGEDNNCITFTAPEGYDQCDWYVSTSASKAASGSEYVWDTTLVTSGTYYVTLVAKNSAGKTRSSTIIVEVNK